MNLSDFDYHLPKELIAQKPSYPRSSSKLYIIEKNLICKFYELYNFLDYNDILVINNTKVIPAVILGEVNGKKIKITLHTKVGLKTWKAFAKPSKNLNLGNIIKFNSSISAKVLSKNDSHVNLYFNVKQSTFYDFLNQHGNLPIPPYIKAEYTKETNEKNYQTIFSKKYGAYASPTASLHFDNPLIKKIKKKKIEIAQVTLHVGAGTFLPLKKNVVANNKLHSEKGFIGKDNALKISKAIKNNKNIVAVGTTVLRLLEDCFAKYSGIIKYNEETQLFIYPGFKFKVVDKLITNFHLPKSSLFLLVSAFGGELNVMNYYKNAIKKKMRFFSYGDAMIINRNDKV